LNQAAGCFGLCLYFVREQSLQLAGAFLARPHDAFPTEYTPARYPCGLRREASRYATGQFAESSKSLFLYWMKNHPVDDKKQSRQA
jgi:hypothetical protein